MVSINLKLLAWDLVNVIEVSALLHYCSNKGSLTVTVSMLEIYTTLFIGRLEISVVSSNPDMLTMAVRDVIIGYRDETTAYYMKTEPLQDQIIMTTVSQSVTCTQ